MGRCGDTGRRLPIPPCLDSRQETAGLSPNPEEVTTVRGDNKMSDIIVEIRGGVLVAVYTDIPNARAVLVDWDEVESPEDLTVAGGIYPMDSVASMPDETELVYQSALRLG